MLPLDAFLLKPVQRVLKYSLLLYEMGKRTQTESDSYEVVQVSLFVHNDFVQITIMALLCGKLTVDIVFSF